jgi:hypothetical protein
MQKRLYTFIGLVFSFTGIWAQQAESEMAQLARSLAQAQLEAYNARDIEAFLIPYSDSVEVYRFPNTLQYKGIDKMRERYGAMFANTPDLHCQLLGRMVQGNTVIDQELVTRKKGEPLIEAIAIYKIAHGKIQRVYFVYSD